MNELCLDGQCCCEPRQEEEEVQRRQAAHPHRGRHPQEGQSTQGNYIIPMGGKIIDF